MLRKKTKSVKLLIVDHADLIRKSNDFKNFDIRVKKVVTGKACLSELDRFKPDFVLSNLMLPDLDGLSLARLFRAQNSHMRLLLMTDIPFSPSLQKVALLEGADAILFAPISPQMLLQYINVKGLSPS